MLKKCKYLLVLIVGLFGFIGFGSCDNVVIQADPCVFYTGTVVGRSTIEFVNSSFNGLIFMGTYNADGGYGESSALWNYYGPDGTNTSIDTYESNVNYNYYGILFPSTGCNFSSSECEECPEIDINYCVENDLCPISSGSRSELVINDIAHEGKPLINIMIPDYIQRDYTGNENQYDIYVGSGYDQDYIDSILKINSYRPDNEDFTQIFVSGLTLIFPYIFVALLIVFIWKLLKRVFK